jgi:hypothetical protein
MAASTSGYFSRGFGLFLNAYFQNQSAKCRRQLGGSAYEVFAASGLQMARRILGKRARKRQGLCVFHRGLLLWKN